MTTTPAIKCSTPGCQYDATHILNVGAQGRTDEKLCAGHYGIETQKLDGALISYTLTAISAYPTNEQSLAERLRIGQSETDQLYETIRKLTLEKNTLERELASRQRVERERLIEHIDDLTEQRDQLHAEVHAPPHTESVVEG